MTVIIPHQDDELKLRNFQKSLISLINKKADASGCVFYELVPLWIHLESEQFAKEEHLKEMGKQITKIEFSSLSADAHKGEISADFKIFTNSGEVSGRLPLASAYKKEKLPAPDFLEKLLKNISLEDIPPSLKIFRLGNAIKTGNNSKSISHSVWVKLKA